MATDTYHHGDLHRALLDAVDEIVREKGFHDLSLREAARRAGVSHAAPAHHFGDKDGLLDAYAIEGFQLLGERFDQASTEGDALDVLEGLGRTYLGFAVDDPAHYAVMFNHTKPHDEYEGSALSVAADAAFERLADAVVGLVRQGRVDEADARYVATLLWGVCHGIAVLWNGDKLPHFYEDHTWTGVLDGVMGVIRGLLERS